MDTRAAPLPKPARIDLKFTVIPNAAERPSSARKRLRHAKRRLSRGVERPRLTSRRSLVRARYRPFRKFPAKQHFVLPYLATDLRPGRRLLSPGVASTGKYRVV
jgi:hypothetical protein